MRDPPRMPSVRVAQAAEDICHHLASPGAIRERQREGIAIAKAKGDVYKGRMPSLSAEKAAALRLRIAAREPKAALAREFGISRASLYNYLKPSLAVGLH